MDKKNKSNCKKCSTHINCSVSACNTDSEDFSHCSHLTVPPLTVLFMLSKRRSLASLRLQRSSSSIRVSRLSVSLHSSFTAPTFSMKIRSFEIRKRAVSVCGSNVCLHSMYMFVCVPITLLTTNRLGIVSPLEHTTSPPSLTASGRICWTSWAITPTEW